MSHTNIISATDLSKIIDSTVLLDCRSRLGDISWGRDAYIEGHIPGALHADMDKDLAIAPNAQGRHPLPTREDWQTCLRRWGVHHDGQVVVYDDMGGAMAARAWWMLRWAGHEAVAVLDGGLSAWAGALQAGQAAFPAASNFKLSEPLTRLIDVDELQSHLTDGTLTVIDARAQPRWAGREEPIDPVAGHIPGAICRPFNANLDREGHFKPAQELATRLHVDENAVYYCGSGVTAAHNILASNIAGLPEPMLYADSWSGWITDPDRPVETDL